MNHQEWYFPFSRDELQASIHNGNCILLQLDVDSRVVAFAVVILKPSDKYRLSALVPAQRIDRDKEAVLETIFVDKEFRGYGMQSLLIDIMCHLAAERKATSLWASVHPENKFSRTNFEKNGFVKMTSDGPVSLYDGVRDIYCRMINGIGMKDKSTGELYYYPY